MTRKIVCVTLMKEVFLNTTKHTHLRIRLCELPSGSVIQETPDGFVIVTVGNLRSEIRPAAIAVVDYEEVTEAKAPTRSDGDTVFEAAVKAGNSKAAHDKTDGNSKAKKR